MPGSETLLRWEQNVKYHVDACGKADSLKPEAPWKRTIVKPDSAKSPRLVLPNIFRSTAARYAPAQDEG